MWYFNSVGTKNKEELFKKAFDLLNLGKTNEALSIYDVILEEFKDDEDAFINKALVFLQTQRFQDCLDLLCKIKDDSVRGFDKILIEASCLHKLNRVDEAEKKYQIISKILPVNKNAILQIGSTCLEQSYFRVAIDIFNKLQEIDSKFEKNYFIGIAYKGLGELTNSIRSLGKALRANPEMYSLYPLIASTCFQNNMLVEGDKLMAILKEKHEPFFQNVAGPTSHYRQSPKENKD